MAKRSEWKLTESVNLGSQNIWPELEAMLLLCLGQILGSVLALKPGKAPEEFIPMGKGRHALLQVLGYAEDAGEMKLAVFLSMPFTGLSPTAAEVLHSIVTALCASPFEGRIFSASLNHTGVRHLGEKAGKDFFACDFILTVKQKPEA